MDYKFSVFEGLFYTIHYNNLGTVLSENRGAIQVIFVFFGLDYFIS